MLAVHYRNSLPKGFAIWFLNAGLALASRACWDSFVDFDGTDSQILRAVWFKKLLAS